MINTLLKIKPTQIKRVAGIFKPGLKSQLVQQLKRTTQRTAGGKLRVFQKGNKKEIYGSRRAVQEGLFEHTTKTLKETGKRTTTGYGNVNVRDLSKGPNFYAAKPNTQVRGGLTNITKATDIGFKSKANVAAKASIRNLRRTQQTIDAGDLSKGYQTIKGHHNLPVELGDAITDGMDPKDIPKFWSDVNKTYKHMASGDNWKNLRLLPEGKEFKHLVGELDVSPHDQTHEMLTKFGISKKNLLKMFKGKKPAERLELMSKLDHKFKKMDQWIFLRMKKWKTGGEEKALDVILASDEVKKAFPNLSKAERRVAIKKWLDNKRSKTKASTAKALQIYSKPLDQKALDTPMAGFTDKAGKQMTLGGN